MNIKRIFCLILAVVMCGLCACAPTEGTTGGTAGTTAPAGPAQYKVTVLDPEGKPCADNLAIKFLKDGSMVGGMLFVDSAGAVTKELDRGDYTVELVFTDTNSTYSYAGADVNLTATKTELTIQLYNSVGAAETLFVKLDETVTADRPAYAVNIGMTKVELEANTRNFYIFTPTKPGIYKFAIEGGAEAIGYYGGTFFVSHINAATPVEGETAITFEVEEGSVSNAGTGTAQLVIGVDTGAVTSGILTITRIGDNTPVIPYDIYPTTTALKKYVHPTGAKVEEFDLNGSYEIVYNEADGYYHVGSEDGPLVLLRLGAKSDDQCKYLLSSMETVNMFEAYVRYYYDEEGELVSRTNFSPCIWEHLEYVDEASGLYPVTKELRHIIQERGEAKGWWEVGSVNYLFWDKFDQPIPVKEDIAWLFNCCYIPA